jgi:hypothetical protein
VWALQLTRKPSLDRSRNGVQVIFGIPVGATTGTMAVAMTTFADRADPDGTTAADQADPDGTTAADQADPDGTTAADQADPDGTTVDQAADQDGTTTADPAGATTGRAALKDPGRSFP